MDNMDSSAVDPLNDTPTLPELSFNDLLDESPVKTVNDNLSDPLELNSAKTSWEDETLNTPGPKKSRTAVMAPKEELVGTKSQKIIKSTVATTTATADLSLVTTPTRIINNLTATTTRDSLQWSSTITTANANQIKATTTTPASTTTLTPMQTLLNNKNILPKTTSSTNQMIKIAPKTNVAAVVGASTAIGNNKTALKAPNGQIYYLQKCSGGMSAVRLSAAPKPLVTTTNANGGMTATTASSVAGSKTVPIQVLRSADGTKNTLTLSPNIATQLAGKKIITNSGNKVVIKASPKVSTTTTTATSTPTATALSDGSKLQKIVPVSMKVTTATTGANGSSATAITTKPTATVSGSAGKFVVQNTNGKHIVVSNQQFIKLSPKPTTPTTPTAAVSGKLQTIPSSGKSGVQYVRVLPSSKTIATSVPTTAYGTTTAAVTTQATASAPTTTSTTGSGMTSSLKSLNSTQKKVTVVRTSAGTTKMILTPVSKNFSPITSKVQQTIVTVPTFRKITDSSSPNINTSTALQQSSSNIAGISRVNLTQRQKISEINAKLQSMTSGGGDESEIKKTATGGRIVMVSRSMLRSNNSGNGGITTATLQRTSLSVASSINQLTTASSTTITTTNNKTPSSPKKLYSGLKTGGSATDNWSDDNTSSTPPPPHPVELKTNAELKSLIICGQAQALMAQQQQHKAQLLQKQRLIHQQQQLQQQMQRQRQQRQQLQQNDKQSKQTQLQLKQQQLKLQFQQQQQLQQINNKILSASNTSNNSSLKVKQEPLDIHDVKEDSVGSVVRRKHCNCTKSQCLKLYCDCFANGEFCQNCNCKDCFNNLQYEDERQKAIRNCLERNPSAFKPKITTAQDQSDMRLHNKGCNCKRSGCLKNYCECYEAKIPCSSNCKCFGCRNIEDRPDLDMDPIDSKILATLVNASNSNSCGGSAAGGGGGLLSAGQKRTYEKMDRNSKQLYSSATCNNNKALTNIGGSNNDNAASCGQAAASAEKQQCNFITQEVIDATIQCMISQADECEKNGLPAYQTEKMVMEELGRCLVEIIDFSIRNTDSSFAQE